MKILESLYQITKMLLRLPDLRIFSQIILQNVNNLKVLFATIDKVLSPSINAFPTPSKGFCESFLNYFIDKIVAIRPNILP